MSSHRAHIVPVSIYTPCTSSDLVCSVLNKSADFREDKKFDKIDAHFLGELATSAHCPSRYIHSLYIIGLGVLSVE